MLCLEQVCKGHFAVPCTVTSLYRCCTTFAGLTTVCVVTVRPEAVLSALRSALRLQQQQSVATLGQNAVFPGAVLCNSNITASLQDPATAVACLSPSLVT